MTDVTSYRTYQQQRGAEFAARIAAHEAAIAASPPAASAAGPLNLIATGDSWFDYPLNGTQDNPNSDILAQLPGFFSNAPKILSLAHFGDATTTLMGTSRRKMLVDQLTNSRAGTFDAILFSGGGNDLVGDQFRLWLRDAPPPPLDPATALNHSAFFDILSVVQTAYQDLIATRDRYAKGTPIFVHAYDFALPTGISVCQGLVGPWLYPSLSDRGWMQSTAADQINIGAAIIRLALTQFSQILAGFGAQNVILVNTFGAVGPTQWDNELHPTPAGFYNVASRFADALQKRFGPRASPAVAAVVSNAAPQVFQPTDA